MNGLDVIENGKVKYSLYNLLLITFLEEIQWKSRFNKLYIHLFNEQIAKDQAKLSEELDSPVYQNGKNRFPEKFYNYGDVYLLWKLVSENRATTLQEAFNLLETQQYRANQMAIQEQIKAIQEDTARSAKIAAVASTVSAVNSTRPRKVEVSGTINHHVN